jgi:hypothetical protein
MKHHCNIFMLGWDRYGFLKKRFRTRYVKLVFLHPVASAGHVVLSGATGAQNIDALCFMLQCDQYGFGMKRIGTRYAELVFLHPVGAVGHAVHSCTSGA